MGLAKEEPKMGKMTTMERAYQKALNKERERKVWRDFRDRIKFLVRAGKKEAVRVEEK